MLPHQKANRKPRRVKFFQVLMACWLNKQVRHLEKSVHIAELAPHACVPLQQRAAHHALVGVLMGVMSTYCVLGAHNQHPCSPSRLSATLETGIMIIHFVNEEMEAHKGQ